MDEYTIPFTCSVCGTEHEYGPFPGPMNKRVCEVICFVCQSPNQAVPEILKGGDEPTTE